MLYLDSSAVLKLLVDENESMALEGYLEGKFDMVTSALAVTEVIIGVRRHGAMPLKEAYAVFETIDLIEIEDAILRSAGTVGLPTLGTLDAIHIATALTLGDELDALVTYDRRMQEAATALGIEFAAPA